jgi:ribosomal protein S18 acetylase RimI-like enzyme
VSTVEIRCGAAADLDALARLLGFLFSIESDFRPDAIRQRRGLAMLLGDPRAAVLVAVEDHRVVGMATAQLLVSTAEGELSALVEDVVVDPEARGRGVGAQLVAQCEEWARSRGATRLQLLADRDNAAALRFYDRAGWRSTRMICLRRGSR